MRRTKILELGFAGLQAIVLIFTVLQNGLSQDNISIKMLEFKYGFQVPFGDMSDRFGGNNDIGVSFNSANLSNNIFYGLEGIYIFGNTVKEDVVQNLRSFDGSIIGIDGHVGDVNLNERGFYVGLDAGKIFKTSAQKNNLTGIRTQIGLGLLQHKIRVNDNQNSIPALDGEYIKGYDRLTNGPAIHLGVGFQYQNPKNNFHFNIMGELYGGSTASRRDFDSLAGSYLDEKRKDVLAGLSLTYVVTLSRKHKADTIYY